MTEVETIGVKTPGQAEVKVTRPTRARRTKAKVSAEKETENDTAKEEILAAISVVADSVKSLSARVELVENYTQTMKPVASPTENDTKPATPGKEDELVQAVRKILGQGIESKCQFNVSTKPDSVGGTFRLKIVPPEHLRVDEFDIRIKRLSYNEGISGAEQYAKTVLDNCIAFAQRGALSFFAEVE